MTAVDIDGDMVRLARHYMRLDAMEARVVVDDAFAFLERDGQVYDVLVDDLYRCGEDDVERPRAVHRDSLDLHLARLAPDGVLVMNFVLGKGHQRQHRAARTAFLEHFPHVRAIRPPLSHNEALVGTRRAEGFRDGRGLRALGRTFPFSEDQRYWKELRNLKLR
jgi:spermidine synthase